MMREVVNDRDSVHFRLYLETALHALEGFKCRLDLLPGNAIFGSQGGGGDCVEHVVFARQRELEIAPGLSAAQYRPGSARRLETQRRDLPIGVLARSITLHRAECFRDAPGNALAGIERDDPASPWYQVHEPLERRLDRIQILVDISVIEFHRGQDDRIGEIVEEFRPLVEERGVVLVPFKDEVFPLPKREARPEIFSNSADQKRWLLPRRLEDPGQHRRRGGLAMRSGNEQHLLPAQKFVMQDLRQRTEWNALVEYVLQFNVAARDRVPHHHQV